MCDTDLSYSSTGQTPKKIRILLLLLLLLIIIIIIIIIVFGVLGCFLASRLFNTLCSIID